MWMQEIYLGRASSYSTLSSQHRTSQSETSGRFKTMLAKSIRRPNLKFISPAEEETEETENKQKLIEAALKEETNSLVIWSVSHSLDQLVLTKIISYI